jgi:hypothetical protein
MTTTSKKRLFAQTLILFSLFTAPCSGVASSNTAYTLNESESIPSANPTTDTTFSLLNDRLFMDMPSDATQENVHVGGIMGSDVGDKHETLFLFERHEAAFTVYVSELFAYGSSDLVEDATRIAAELSDNTIDGFLMLSNERVQDTLTMVSIELDPCGSLRTNQGNFLGGELVRTQENLLLLVSIYGDDAAEENRSASLDLTRKILASIRAGTRAIDVTGRSYAMEDHAIQLLPGYVPNVNIGPDFTVWYFSKLSTFGVPSPSFGIYVGNHPSAKLASDTTLVDEALGIPMTWHLSLNESGQFDENTHAEALVQLTSECVFGSSYWHFFANPDSEADFAEIRQMVRSFTGPSRIPQDAGAAPEEE